MLQFLLSSASSTGTRHSRGRAEHSSPDDALLAAAVSTMFSPAPLSPGLSAPLPPPTAMNPSPASLSFPTSVSASLLSPVLEEDEDLLAAFPVHSPKALQRALFVAVPEAVEGDVPDDEVGDVQVRVVVPDEVESLARGLRSVSFSSLPDRKPLPAPLHLLPRRPPTPAPLFLTPVPSPASASFASSSSRPTSPSSATFSDASSAPSSAPPSASTTPSSCSFSPPPTRTPFAHSRSTTSTRPSTLDTDASGGLSRCTTRTIDSGTSKASSSSRWSGKSTARFLRRLFSPSSSPGSSEPSSPREEAHEQAVLDLSYLPPSTLSSLASRLQADAAASASPADAGSKRLLKELKRLEKLEKKKREKEAEERMEREWREKRERRKGGKARA